MHVFDWPSNDISSGRRDLPEHEDEIFGESCILVHRVCLLKRIFFSAQSLMYQLDLSSRGIGSVWGCNSEPDRLLTTGRSFIERGGGDVTELMGWVECGVGVRGVGVRGRLTVPGNDLSDR